MIKLLRHILLLSVAVFLWGCPYESPYALDLEPAQFIDENLLGKWAAMVQRPSYEGQMAEAPVKVIFEPKSEKVYNIRITGYTREFSNLVPTVSDTVSCTGYLSPIDNRLFLNIILSGRVYIAEVVKQSNILNIMTLSERFTNKFIRSCSELRRAVSTHYRNRAYPIYDEWFILKDLQKVN